MSYKIKTIWLVGNGDFSGNTHNVFANGLYAKSEEDAKYYVENTLQKCGVIKPVKAIFADDKVFILKDGLPLFEITNTRSNNDVQPNDVQPPIEINDNMQAFQIAGMNNGGDVMLKETPVGMSEHAISMAKTVIASGENVVFCSLELEPNVYAKRINELTNIPLITMRQVADADCTALNDVQPIKDVQPPPYTTKDCRVKELVLHNQNDCIHINKPYETIRKLPKAIPPQSNILVNLQD